MAAAVAAAAAAAAAATPAAITLQVDQVHYHLGRLLLRRMHTQARASLRAEGRGGSRRQPGPHGPQGSAPLRGPPRRARRRRTAHLALQQLAQGAGHGLQGRAGAPRLRGCGSQAAEAIALFVAEFVGLLGRRGRPAERAAGTCSGSSLCEPTGMWRWHARCRKQTPGTAKPDWLSQACLPRGWQQLSRGWERGAPHFTVLRLMPRVGGVAGPSVCPDGGSCDVVVWAAELCNSALQPSRGAVVWLNGMCLAVLFARAHPGSSNLCNSRKLLQDTHWQGFLRWEGSTSASNAMPWISWVANTMVRPSRNSSDTVKVLLALGLAASRVTATLADVRAWGKYIRDAVGPFPCTSAGLTSGIRLLLWVLYC
mmetsp:Transcript_41327/g.131459  ORF Transcript_41327/g.131459 Transcript_41327/m.131459 type:complete len:368 (-) Transcript_41327:1140-2243(-)